MAKQRLDILLVEKNLSISCQQAQGFILAGMVKVNDHLVDKPGTEIDINATITVTAKPRYVSRGGEKLAKALDFWSVNVTSRICLDGGISTGGFTDCLFQAGAKQVYGVDVGYGQVAWNLRQDERLVLQERTNFRYLTCSQLYGDRTPADLGVMDLSFISLTKVLPTLWELLLSPKEAILLVKPQFEVPKKLVGKKGVVRNPLDHAQAIFSVWQAASRLGWQYQGLTWSPLTGPAGNIEYLLWISSTDHSHSPDLSLFQDVTHRAMVYFQDEQDKSS